MNITPIAHIPVWGMVTSLWAKRDQLKQVNVLPLIEDGTETSLYREWKVAQRAMAMVRKVLTKGEMEPDIISAQIEALKAKAFTSAKIMDGHERHRFHLPLVTSPRAYLYHESQSFAPGVGVLTYVPLPYVAANQGDEVRIHLIVDVLPRELEPAPLPEAP